MKFLRITACLLFLGSLFFAPVEEAGALLSCTIDAPASVQVGTSFDVGVTGLVGYVSGTAVTLNVTGAISFSQSQNYGSSGPVFNINGSLATDPGTAVLDVSIVDLANSANNARCYKNVTITAAGSPPPPASSSSPPASSSPPPASSSPASPSPAPAPAPSPSVGCPPGAPPGSVCIENPLKATTLLELLNNIINFIFNLSIVITPLMVVIGGFMFITGSGDAKKISDARTLLLWTAIGFAVILLSRGLVAVLLSVLGTT